MDQTTNLISSSQGWGVDLLPENRPGIPREGQSQGKTGVHWTEPEQQIPRVKILKTLERPQITPVFGTTCPPKGLSGKIRKRAFRFSENAMRHWLYLLAADRVNVVEGLIEDLAKGKLPHVIREMGLSIELKNRQKLADRLSRTRKQGGPLLSPLVFSGLALAAFAVYRLSKSSSSSQRV